MNDLLKPITNFSKYIVNEININEDYFRITTIDKTFSTITKNITNILFSQINLIQLHLSSCPDCISPSIEFVTKNNISFCYLKNNSLFYQTNETATFDYEKIFEAFRKYNKN